MVSAELHVPNTSLLGERAPDTDRLSLNQKYWALNKLFNSYSKYLTTLEYQNIQHTKMCTVDRE